MGAKRYPSPGVQAPHLLRVIGRKPGGEQPSFDKQYVRNYLEELVARGAWDKTAPGPKLPQDVIENTMVRYRSAYERLTGKAINLEAF